MSEGMPEVHHETRDSPMPHDKGIRRQSAYETTIDDARSHLDIQR